MKDLHIKERGKIEQEFNEVSTKIDELEPLLANLKVRREHLREAYRRLEQIEKELVTE